LSPIFIIIMALTTKEKEDIMRSFPNVKLSYENIIHKKVSNFNWITAVPKGAKCFVWITYYKDRETCFVIELTHRKEVADIKIVNVAFNDELAYGTLFYGTTFYASRKRFITVEDIFLYRGINLVKTRWIKKLECLHFLFKKEIKQTFHNKTVVLGLPVICNTFEEMEQKLETLQYPVYSLQFYLANQFNTFLSMNYTSFKNLKDYNYPSTRKELTFVVRPDIQDDIYYLYALDQTTGEEVKHSIAHIPNFNTSVMMNKIFRIIKENDNLDALEESDDEEEFENNNADKFVKLDMSKKMVCQYNLKFKKWTPLCVASENGKVYTVNAR